MFKGIISVKSTGNCRICKKTFCCAKCRDRHADKVHPGLNGSCILCASETLPTRQFESEKLDLGNEELLSHIIDKHLPLSCQLCGDIFESKEDFKSFGACKWWSRHCLTSPVGFGYLDKKSKRCSMSDSDDKFYTPSEIYRKTSTPMFAGQKINEEYPTPCISDFSLKTPRANSSSIVQCNGTAKTYDSQNSESRDTEFFSFSVHITNENTPFKINKDDQFSRSNSGRKLNIMEEQDETADRGKTAIINGSQTSSPVDMDLTGTEGGILRDSPQLDPICEEPDETPEIVKKVRFSDEHKIQPEFEERMESCVKNILNTSIEDDEFHDAYIHVSSTNAKDATEENPTKIIGSTEDEKETKCNQEDRIYALEKSLQNCLNDLHIIQDNVKKNEKEKENQNSEINCISATTSQQGSRMLMMVLVENNSGGNDDLMPLINSGLKKLQEQVASTNYSSLNRIEPTGINKLRRQSVTKMQMTVSTVESYSVNSTATTTATTTTNCQEIVSSLPAQNKNNNDQRNGGFLSSFAQAVKYALRSFSRLNVSPNSIEAPKEEVQRQENTEKPTIRPELFSDSSSSNSTSNSIQIRSGKRARDVTEVPSKRDSLTLTLEGRSPLAKRHRRWYTMVKGRKPIARMRSNCATSSRGVSTETQIFSQGSLTVGDTILPLPARAHQSMQIE